MEKHWEGSVHIDAPVDQVFPYLADFTRHPEWDQSTLKVEKLTEGDDTGVGAEWKIYEAFDLFGIGRRETKPKLGTGLVKRVVRDVVPNHKVEWHAQPIPRIGVTADYLFQVEEEDGGTKVTQQVTFNVHGVLDAATRVLTKNLDKNIRQIWPQNLQQLESVVTQAKSA
ncbi:MAG: SRPBCC family protein [Thermomicrobiales bacterium]